MQGLRIVSRDGSAVGQDEIEAAHRVVATFGGRAFGTPSATDDATGVRVEYHAHKNMAIVEPAGVDYRLVSFPSPWPGKKLSVQNVFDNLGPTYYLATVGVCVESGDVLATIAYDDRYEILTNGWDGSSSVQFFDAITYAPTRSVPFVVPADCISSNGEGSIYWGSAEESAFRANALDRRATWSEAMTRDTMAFDFTGAPDLWATWDLAVKNNQPASIKLQRVFGPSDTPLVESVLQSVVSDDTTSSTTTAFPGGPGDPYRALTVRTMQLRRDVSLRFKLADEAGVVTEMTEVLTGWYTFVATIYTSLSDGGPTYVSSVFYSSTYVNWYTAHNQGVVVESMPADSVPVLSDLCAHQGLGSPENTPGVVWTGSETFSDPGYGPVAYCHAHGFANPPIVSSNDITWTVPAIIAEYLRLLTIRKSSLAGFDNRYPGRQPESFHLFTAAASVRRVDAILFGAVRSGRSLGMYWQRDWDVDPADHLIDGVDIYGILRMRWDTARGRLVVVGMTPVQSPNPSDPPGTPARVMFTAQVPHLGANAVLRFSGLKHLDMRARAKTLRAYLREDPPAHAPEVAELLGTNWSANPERDAVQTIVAGILAAIGDL